MGLRGLFAGGDAIPQVVFSCFSPWGSLGSESAARAADIVRELVDQRVDEVVVLPKALGVLRAQLQGNGLPVVRVLPEQVRVRVAPCLSNIAPFSSSVQLA